MPSHQLTLLDLRGIFFFSERGDANFSSPFGAGRIAHAVPINDESVLINTETSVFLYVTSRREKLWEIVCPSLNFAINLQHHLLALTPENTIITLWDLRTGELLSRLTYSSDNTMYRVNPNSLKLNHNGRILAAGMRSDMKSIIALWDTADGHLLRVLLMEEYHDEITTLAFHPTAPLLAVGSFYSSRVWFWNLDNGDLLKVWDLSKDDCSDRVYDLSFNHDGTQLFACGGTYGLRVWDVKQQQEAACPLSTTDLHPGWIAVSPSGHFLATIHFDSVDKRPLRIFESKDYRTLYEFMGKFARPFFNLEGELIAVVSSSKRGPAHLINIQTGEEINIWIEEKSL